MSKQSDAHNIIAPEAVRLIVAKTIDAGGDGTQVLVTLESVICGVMLAVIDPIGDDVALATMSQNVKIRLADMRLSRVETAGRA